MMTGTCKGIWRRTRRTVSLALLACFLVGSSGWSAAALLAKKASPGDELFNDHLIPRLRIEIPAEGMAILQSYVWDKKTNGKDRTNVLATVREGKMVYTNVALHLKGGLGSFRPVDATPPLTL